MRDPKVSNVPNESKLQRALMPNSRMFLLFLILFAVITFFFSDRLWLSICEGVIILLLIIYSVIMRARKRRTLERYIESVTYDTESARNNTLQNFPLPMAVFRPADSQVIWANQNFFDLRPAQADGRYAHHGRDPGVFRPLAARGQYPVPGAAGVSGP